jgi:aminopeptidase N
VDAVLALQDHPAFDWRNPNKIRALVGVFANANPLAFHRQDGAGYRLLADAIIRMQAANPQIAARLCTPLTRFKRYAHGVDLMRAELERIASVEGLSRDVFEVVDRSLRS